MGLYDRMVRTDGSATGGLDPAVREAVPANGLRLVTAHALQSVGDQVVNAKTVLPWLLASLGAPASFVGLLVPLRESGSMLPQAAIISWVRRRRLRKWVWVAGAAGQSVAVAAMALAAATSEGTAAGIAILVALTVFALARSLTSLASKDVLGRTVPKGQRGQINGLATLLSGAVAITVGLAIRFLGGDDVAPGVLAWLLAGAAAAWVVAAVVFGGVHEPASESPDDDGDTGWVRRSWALLREDATFRRFVVVRTLLLVSALSPPFVVALAAARGGVGLSGLGPFVIASGVAGLVGGRIFGRMADDSSRRLMVLGAAAASVTIVVFLALLAVPAVADAAWLYPAVYLLLALTHTGVRVARKTYVVDMAEGDRRTQYVAVANTSMGVLLLVAGAVSSALAALGPEVALGFLAVLGLAGVAVGRSLPEVSHRG